MKNTLGDLNNHLFAQLERLSDEDVKEEMARAKAVTGLASQIIANGTLVLKARMLQLEYGSEDGGGEKKIPPMLKAQFLKE